MYRLRSFFKEFFKFILKADSVWSISYRVILVLTSSLIYAFLKSPVYISIYFPSSSWHFHQLILGSYLSSILIIIFIFIGIGVALGRSFNFKLHINNELEPDINNVIMRLPISNLGIKTLKPTATIQWVKNREGKQIDANVFPIKISWMHNNDAVHHGNVIKADVAVINNNQIIFGFNRKREYYHSIPQIEYATFCVRITIPDTNIYYEKIFSLEKNVNYPLGYKATLINGICKYD